MRERKEDMRRKEERKKDMRRKEKGDVKTNRLKYFYYNTPPSLSENNASFYFISEMLCNFWLI